ncbi:hypothetical protein ACFPT7_03265 [Acidicapsa dinghuensis]|uniref:VWA domain-containing protein n=1 Tax=Acidicapsa dinghuensis TaxID=2218256 RepID=A0ABW1EB82_9BACT|nr:hypothetical protein [Acidicapsa dinghuensis]
MKLWKYVAGSAAVLALLGVYAFPQEYSGGQGQAVITVLPKNGAPSPDSLTQGLSLKVNGKDVKVTDLRELQNSPVELVILIDGSARTNFAQQLRDIAQFVKSLPPNVRTAVAYMQNGTTRFAGAFTADHNAVLQGLRVPAGLPGSNGSPYICLSDLATHWPSQDRAARREVIMITDGFDEYNPRYDPEDPYLQAALHDSIRAHLVVYSIYWRDLGRIDRTRYADDAGQNLLQQLTDTTGGKNYWIGLGNPVSFQPYLEDLAKRLQNQYELSFTAQLKGKAEIQSLKLKLNTPGTKVDAPQQVYVAPPSVAQE